MGKGSILSVLVSVRMYENICRFVVPNMDAVEVCVCVCVRGQKTNSIDLPQSLLHFIY